MEEPVAIILRTKVSGITLDVCHGEIPDVFRQLWFSEITEPELPDAKVSDNEFNDWLSLYRHSNCWFERQLLEESLCN